MEPARSPVAAATKIFSALRERDLTIFQTTNHPDVVDDFVAVGEFRGVDAVRGFFAEIFAAFPDFDIEAVQMVGDAEHAVVQWHATGTFIGPPFQRVHATGRRIELRGCDVMRFEEGKLKHNTVYYDGLSFARQVGLLPKEGSTADKAMTAAFNAGTDVRARIPHSDRARRLRLRVSDGYVGEVLSTTMVGLSVPGDVAGKPNADMLDKTHGANVLTNAVGRSLDILSYVLGEFAELSAVSDLRRPLITIEETGEQIVKTAADQIAVIGNLTSGATASVHVREAVAGGTGFRHCRNREVCGIRETRLGVASCSEPSVIDLLLPRWSCRSPCSGRSDRKHVDDQGAGRV